MMVHSCQYLLNAIFQYFDIYSKHKFLMTLTFSEQIFITTFYITGILLGTEDKTEKNIKKVPAQSLVLVFKVVTINK